MYRRPEVFVFKHVPTDWSVGRCNSIPRLRGRQYRDVPRSRASTPCDNLVSTKLQRNEPEVTIIDTDENVSLKFSDKKRAGDIAKAAALLFDTNGYAETSLRDISIAAGLSKGGIYHYFSSKHEILFLIVDGYLDVLHDRVKEDLAEIEDPRAKLRFFLDRHLRIYLEHMPEGGEFLNHARDLPQREQRCIAHKEKDYASILTGILAEMVDTEKSNAKLKAVTYFIFGLCNSIMHWYNPAGEIPLEEVSDICYQLLMDGWTSLSSSQAMN